MYRFETLAPLTGPTVAGPLGIVHLPRMWLKGVLSAAGLLMPDYFDGDKGFNHRVVEGLGLAPERWFAFLATMPTYPQAEDYVREHASRLDAVSIAAVNAQILTRKRPEEADVRAQIINLEDWATVHEQLLAHRAGGIEPLVPMVSSSQAGPLGIAHLPRLWMKSFESATGALPAEWKTGISCGFDCFVATLIGLDIEAATAFIHANLADYPTFEAWVNERIGRPDDETKAQWTNAIRTREKTAEQAAGDVAEAQAPGVTSRVAALLNDLVDWHHMHAFAVARASGAGLATA
jgi:hypothetical protein